MRSKHVNSVTRAAALGGLALLAAWPLAARSDVPSYASGPPPETITGTIYSITSRYTLTLEDERGFEDSVTLHDGTVITPTGLSLGSGQGATIIGHTDGKTFDADEIDVDPQTISTGQALLPAADYNAVAYGSEFPGYAFGYNPAAYGIDGFVGPYAAYGNYYGGYYGGGYSYQNPTITVPTTGTHSGTPVARRPVNGPPGYLPPGARYPTGYRGVNPIVRGGSPTRFSAPQFRSAPQFHPAPAPASRSH